MNKYKISVVESVERIYEVEAENEDEAQKTYWEFDETSGKVKFIEEKEVDGLDTQVEITKMED